MNTKPGIRMKNPVHPGDFINHEVIKAQNLSVTTVADQLGVPHAELSALLNERAALTPTMALRIEEVFGVSGETLMRMQNSYENANSRPKPS